MKLFVKIFLWFFIAVTLMNFVIVFVTRTFQTEPMVSRFERSTRNQMKVYGGTANQIVSAEGEAGLRTFLDRIREIETSRKVDLVASDNRTWFGDAIEISDAINAIDRTRSSGAAETDFSGDDRSIGTAPVNFPDGRQFVLVLQWERPVSSGLYFGTWLANLRLLGVAIVAAVLCYVLALYLTSPIRKLRNATKRLADGDLQARVETSVTKRRDELADLARDFDEMAERIEGLITSQQRLNRDISHELRSPLARLNVALELAKAKSGPESQSLLNRIESESSRLNEMIGRLLQLSQLESGVDVVDKRRIDLGELVKDVAADADFEAKGIDKVVQIGDIDKCNVNGSEELLRSAIENVLRNAVRYTAERTAVEVSLARQNGHAIVTIADHGGGVPEDELKNLFRPFYRVGEDRTRSTGGTGLGLAIAERAVKAHKGQISAVNHNGGLKVEIKLDAA